MKNFRTSYYAYNIACKDEIVYPTATGEIIRLKSSDFNSEEEFLKWKAFSDEMYHKEQKADNAASNKIVNIDFIEETDVDYEEGCDAKMAHCEYVEELQRETEKLMSILSEKQRRRLYMAVIRGMKQEEIAELEGCSQRMVGKSIQASKKKIKKYLEKILKTGSKISSENALSERVSFYEKWLANHSDETNDSEVH